MPESRFRKSIDVVARDLSRMRKAEKLNYANLDEAIQSTPDEMLADWRHAVIFWIDRLMTRALSIGELDSACYSHLEGIWIDQIKEYRAYHYWIQARHEGTFWTPREHRDRHYFWACEELRDALVNPGCKEPAATFSEPQHYIRTGYLADGGTVWGPRINELIDAKAQRLAPKMGWDSARTCAKGFVTAFYQSITPAVVDTNREAILKVLEALQHSGSLAGAPGIVNGFEALLAILYLDRQTIKDLWESGEVRREAIF
jgi:hypothetical protein